MTVKVEDWLSRVIIPDMYPRRDDPFRPSAGSVPQGAPPASMVGPEALTSVNLWDGWYTSPAMRPVVYQRALNFQITANTTAVPLTSGSFQCDTMVLDVESTVGNSVFFGFGNGITTTSGIEIFPGFPLTITPENTREPWELQRLLEAIAGMIGSALNVMPMGTYRAPRVIFNANDYYVIAASSTTVRVMLFMVPEYQ